MDQERDTDLIAAEVANIESGGALGRSRVYRRLLAYLAECTAEGRSAREVEIAADVLEKGSEFDSNQDSLVRVYMHNLRQKLDQHYESSDATGPRVYIPKGEYRLALEHVQPETVARPFPRLLAGFAVIAVLNAAAWLVWVGNDEASSAIWAPLLEDDKPLLLVVGDYYIFAELDAAGNVQRMVREFNVNSSVDLNDPNVVDPQTRFNYMDLDLTYLPRGAAFALSSVLQVVHRHGKEVRVVPSSELRIDDMRRNHVVYVGYISALNALMDYAFAGSELRIGDTYDEFVVAGRYFRSSAGIPGQTQYKDYGLISRFPGPGGTQVLIVAGTRDSGLMHSAQSLSEPAELARLSFIAGEPVDARSFEVVYEVTGLDRMPLDARLVHQTFTNTGGIWGGESATLAP